MQRNLLPFLDLPQGIYLNFNCCNVVSITAHAATAGAGLECTGFTRVGLLTTYTQFTVSGDDTQCAVNYQ